MFKLNNDELMMVVGGINITGTILNAISRGVEIIFEIGKSIGTALRRSISDKMCSIWYLT